MDHHQRPEVCVVAILLRRFLAVAVAAGAVVAISGALPAYAAALTVPATLRVMPLGDSITYGVGSSTTSSYRAELWKRLATNGFGASFVGSMSSGQLPDPNNEGHSGWTIGQVAAKVRGWLAAATPSVVLLHIGTNDVKRASTAPGAPARLSALIDQIRGAAPAATIFVAQIVPGGESGIKARVAEFDDAIPAIVASKNSQKVRLVDQYDALTRSDLADELHPDDSGYLKMAATWYAAMAQVLPRGGLIGSALSTTGCAGTGSPATGFPVLLWSCDGGGAQSWIRRGEFPGTMGRCPDLTGGARGEGTRLALAECTDAASEQGQVRADWPIEGAVANRCAGVPASGTVLGSRLIICGGTAEQMWEAR
jgi:lysophospholipase L1-like esterase